MRKLFVIMLLGILIAGCSILQSHPEEKTARGVLKHFPSNVMSPQAWYGHYYMVDSTPILPTETVSEDILKKHIGNFVVVTGIWHPGEYWRPTEGEMSMPMPVDSEKDVIIRNDGLKALSIIRVER